MTSVAKGKTYIDRSKYPTLDLHGYTLEPAIRKLVEFLETYYERQRQLTTVRTATTDASTQKETFLVVVTGTGSHSNNSMGGGPVLKYAVDDFLQRHSFQYTYHTKGGSFVIPIANNTGMLTYQSKSCKMDTKLVVTTSPSTAGKKSLSTHVLNRQNKLGSRTSDKQQNHSVSISETMPTLQEVVYEEKQLERGKTKSLDEYRIRQREFSIEQKLYQQAIKVSKDEIRFLEKEDDDILSRAIEESVLELSERTADDDIEEIAIKEAIIQSLEQSERVVHDDGYYDDEEELLRRAILESQTILGKDDLEANDDYLRLAIRESEMMKDISESEDEKEFQRILEQMRCMKQE